MTTNKPEVFRFHCHGRSAPAYNCNKPADNSGEYVRLAEYEALQAECEKLRLLLSQSAPIVHSHAGASHMLEGFKPKRNKWDALVEQIDAACRKQQEGRPAPDVAKLVEALDRARDRIESERRSGEWDPLLRDIDAALTAHRKGGE